MTFCVRRIGLGAVLVTTVLGCGRTGDPVRGESAEAVLEQETAALKDRDRDDAHHHRTPSLGDRAERGLAISPVPVHTEGLTRKEKLSVGLGSYIVNGASDCNGCHGSAAGFLSGGNPFFLDATGHVVWSRNLTPDAETGLKLTEAQFLEAMRTGRDFHADQTKMLVVMPWVIFRWMSEEDLKAVYAYLRAIPAVHNPVPTDNKSDLPLATSVPFPGFYNDGEVDRRLSDDQDSFSPRRGLAIAPRAHPHRVDEDDLRPYGLGSYIVNSMALCSDCHTHPDRTADFSKINTPAYLTGGTVFAVPPPLQPVLGQVRTMSANLKGATHGFFNEPDDSFRRFRTLIRTQSHADEVPPRPLGFPMNGVAANLAHLLDPDLRAIYQYVKAVPSVTGSNDVERQNYARYCAADADCASGESCSLPTHECVGKACAADVECDVCQTCNAGSCAPPAADSACLASAQ